MNIQNLVKFNFKSANKTKLTPKVIMWGVKRIAIPQNFLQHIPPHFASKKIETGKWARLRLGIKGKKMQPLKILIPAIDKYKQNHKTIKNGEYEMFSTLDKRGEKFYINKVDTATGLVFAYKGFMLGTCLLIMNAPGWMSGLAHGLGTVGVLHYGLNKTKLNRSVRIYRSYLFWRELRSPQRSEEQTPKNITPKK